MRVLIDGHNAMGALGTSGKTHEARRRSLLRCVGALAARSTVFFDARGAPAPSIGMGDRTSELGIDVVYCRRREADALILDEVRDADAPGRLIVVTNDREVAGRAAQLGARAVGVQEYFGTRKEEEPEATPRRLPNIHPRLTPKDFGLPDEVDLDDPDID